tara:strand:+ start:60 stop:926 length:867 start_codon:yes stop_codon:yes gene_type:complete
MDSYSIISNDRCILGESPVWDEKLQRIYWVDIEGKCLHAWSYIENKKLIWNFDHRLCAISLTNQNNILLCAFDTFFSFFDISNHIIKKLDKQVVLPSKVRFNDGKTDGYGRFWCGTMSESNPSKPDGALYMIDNKLEIHEIIKGIHISNSITSSLDSRFLYYADTYKKLIFKADLNNKKPYLDKSRIIIDNKNLKGFPDGSTIDKNGCLWNAEWNGGQVVQYDELGQIINIMKTPMKKPTCIAFGGLNMNKLFITSAKDNNNDQHDISGNTICIDTKVKGLYSNRFYI